MFYKLTFLTLILAASFFGAAEVAWAGDSELAAKLCEIRQIFCGNSAGGVLVTLAIIFLGILTLNGKMHWTIVILITAGIIIFLNAEDMPQNMTDQAVEIDEGCICY